MKKLNPPSAGTREYFLQTPLSTILEEHASTNIEERQLALFQRCVQQVPAYRRFLAAQRINPAEIRTFRQFQSLPLLDKVNYMQAYPLPERCFNGSLLGADRVAVSSGSTGLSTFWPRSAADEAAVALRFEQVFADSFQAHERSTLAVVCFALGNWVGGMFTTSCCWQLAAKGYPLMVATPGNQPAEIFRVVREMAPHFQQTVLLGYPPFIKDVIDAGRASGIDWSAYQMKLVFAGEVFSEEWRELLGKRTGSKSTYFDSASLYGTADAGVLGNETPFSIAIRRWLASQPMAARQLFGESRLPTLVQYDPVSRFFEVHEDTLVISADCSVPLLRYHIADKGGLLTYAQMWRFLQENGVQSLLDLGLPVDFQPRELPFVYVFGRADFTVSYYGANIYPENISVGLEQVPICNQVSGKFVLETLETSEGDKYLQIAVELLADIEAGAELSERVGLAVLEQLRRLNSEFTHYVPPDKQLPTIKLCSFGDAQYFPVGVKHRYTRNKQS